MKPFTTSAQKTITLDQTKAISRLKKEMEKETGKPFIKTSNKNIIEAKLDDGSTLAIAGFPKENGTTIVMIDHKNLSGTLKRDDIQKKWRKKLDELF